MPQLVSHKAPKRYCLLSLMSIFMIGSAVWLKLILFAELWETPQHDILYERQRTECGERCHQGGRNGAPAFDVAEGLRLSVDMDACKLQHPPPLRLSAPAVSDNPRWLGDSFRNASAGFAHRDS